MYIQILFQFVSFHPQSMLTQSWYHTIYYIKFQPTKYIFHIVSRDTIFPL